MKTLKYLSGLAFLLFFVFDASAQGDNLGNHLATQDLSMQGNSIHRIVNLNMYGGHNSALRFYGSNSYRIAMHNGSEYHYGPVNKYSIKTTMPKLKGWGWTWGTYGSTPVAALSVGGTFQISNNLYALGRVGIGITNPAYALDVCGTARAKEVLVETGWCDYVFEDDYVLRSLEEVESFIDKNKHLPDVPAGIDIEENGLKLAEMQATHMLKIEELTLYIIELNKEVQRLKSIVEPTSK